MRASCVLALVGIVCAVSAAQANVTFGFNESCTNNNAGDVNIGLAQMRVDIADAGSGRVDFTFRNLGPAASSITDLYWDDGTLLGIAIITNGPGVDFSIGASPGDLPGGNSCAPPFIATQGFSSDSNPPSQPNGVNPGEWVTVRFDLINGRTYAQTLAALDTGELRIGIHVQGFATGNSESFVLPSPSAAAILGLAGLAGLRRRR
jgi:uncharacterized protein (TIGR03382 family)